MGQPPIRGREQQLIKQNGGAQSEGGTSGNAINGVGQNNPKAGQYAAAAEEEFGTVEEQLENNIRNPPTPVNNTEPPLEPPD